MVTVEEFKAKIDSGTKIEANDDMPEEYRKALLNLLQQQADSELSGAYGYIPWIEKAPSVHEKLLVAQIVKDETRHAYAMFKLLTELGIDTENYIKKQEYAYRIDDGNSNIGTKRLKDDKRVNIFYYPIETWCDFILFNFLMDRGAGHQLEDTLDSSYAPWARTIKTIFDEEMMHVVHGDTWVKRLCQDPDTRDELQEGINKWYPRVMNIFGRPRTEANDLYVQMGLKKRTNVVVRDEFEKEVREKLEEYGGHVTLPDWSYPED